MRTTHGCKCDGMGPYTIPVAGDRWPELWNRGQDPRPGIYICRLDYCNALLHVITDNLFRRLQSIQNASGDARICCEEGQSLKLCHGAVMVDYGAGCSSCSMTKFCDWCSRPILIERAVSCWYLHQLISQTTQYLEVEGYTCHIAP